MSNWIQRMVNELDADEDDLPVECFVDKQQLRLLIEQLAIARAALQKYAAAEGGWTIEVDGKQVPDNVASEALDRMGGG